MMHLLKPVQLWFQPHLYMVPPIYTNGDYGNVITILNVEGWSLFRQEKTEFVGMQLQMGWVTLPALDGS